MTQRVMSNYKCSLSEGDLDKAKRELTEDPETRKMEIQTLRERLLRYPGLTPRVDDVFLLKFLRPKKFDQERTFKLILNYYKMKKDNEVIYAEMTPQHIYHVLEAGMFTFLPGRSKMGETLVLFRAELWDPAKISMEDVFKASHIINSCIIESEAAQVNGIRYISDLRGLNWSHVMVFTPSMAQKMSHQVQDAFPLRVKGVHYVNEPSVFDYIFAILKPFLNDKMKSRINFHGERYEELLKFIDIENIPAALGGKLPSLCTKEFMKTVLDKQTAFEEDAKFGFVSMTIKQESKKSADAMDNLPGTFKKLNVD